MVSKKTNCKNCGVFDGTLCRLGLGRSKPKDHCGDIWRIKDRRCGNCTHFSLIEGGKKRGGHCDFYDDYRNFYNSCYFAYTKEEGKDLRPFPEAYDNTNLRSPLTIIIDE